MPPNGSSRHRIVPPFISRQVRTSRLYYLNLFPEFAQEVVVSCGGWENCRADYLIDRTDLPYIGIELVTAGRGEVILAGQTYSLSEGAVYAYFPRERHVIRTDSQRPLTKFFVALAGVRAEQIVRGSPAANCVVWTSRPEELVALFEQLDLYASHATPLAPQLCAALVEVLVLKIAESSVPAGPFGESFATYQMARELIRKRFADFATLEDVAAACGVATSYLCRLFQRFGQETGYQFLIKTKMNRAVAIFLESHASVKAVAEQLGYADPFHFSRVFKRVHGISPEQFKRLIIPSASA